MSTPRSSPALKAETHSLFVQGLPMVLETNGLREFFAKFGQVCPSTRVIRDRGYGFVDFVKAESVEAVLNAANGPYPLQIDGLQIKVERAKAPETGEITSGTGGSITTSSTSDFGGNGGGSPPPSRSPDKDSLMRPKSSFDKTHQIRRSNNGMTISTKKTEIPTVNIPAERRSVQVPLVPVQATVEDVIQVFSVFGKLAKVSFYLARSSRSSSNNDEAIDEAALRTAKSFYYLRVRFETCDAALAAQKGCEKEDIKVMRSNPHSDLLRVGEYTVPPSFLDALESLSTFGGLISMETVLVTTGCIVEFDDQEASLTAAKAAQQTSVFLRGTQLQVQSLSSLFDS